MMKSLQRSTPATPGTGYSRIYPKTDGRWYFVNPDGVETSVLDSNHKGTFIASATSGASLNVPHGAAPTSPVNGDMWTTTAGLYVRINGSTVGPLS